MSHSKLICPWEKAKAEDFEWTTRRIALVVFSVIVLVVGFVLILTEQG